MERKYQGGAFFAVGSSEVDKKIISCVKEIADNRGCTMAAVALAWILEKDTTPIVGMAKVGRVENIVGLKGKSLGESDVKYCTWRSCTSPGRFRDMFSLAGCCIVPRSVITHIGL